MNSNDVIESYVLDVMRRLSGRERNEIGLELRGLLTEMLAERQGGADKRDDDATVLAMLRDFGTPADVAQRYGPPGMVIIPAAQTRSFAVLSLAGVGLQWVLTLPRVFHGQSLSSWWLGWGLGSFWWPGLMVMLALLATVLRRAGLFQPRWKRHIVDPDRVTRSVMAFGLFWFAAGAMFMVSLPWISRAMPDPLAHLFVFDPDFLHKRAWAALVLWVAAFANLCLVLYRGRWSPLTRWLDIAFSVAWVAVFLWWLAAADIFQMKPTDDGAKAGIVLVMLIIVVDVAVKLYRQRARIRMPQVY